MSESPVPTDDDFTASDVRRQGPSVQDRIVRRDRGRLLSAILRYSALRFGLTAVLTLALMFLLPLVIAMAIAIIVQLPLSMLLFSKQGERAGAALAELRAERRAERAALRGALYGGQGHQDDAAAS